ncbi:GNAT family N-acetyltransferase [Salinispora oceanensis]|uniref:GNAT family N-acetyltransferase n=1 Tax=Salinispora oceanensis TaxID=1050199 RepID=UPI0009B77C74|nr:GNAT family N-acetyltransferase [Salinispora oceanensis]
MRHSGDARVSSDRTHPTWAVVGGTPQIHGASRRLPPGPRYGPLVVGGVGHHVVSTVPAVVEVRRAEVEDAAELVRLRGVMLADVDGADPQPGRWSAAAAETLQQRLADPLPSLAAFVVERNTAPQGLAACAVGVIEHRLGSPDNPSGNVGYIFNVATDRDCRRRGYSRACMQALLGWYQQRGVTRVDLRASRDGESLYRALGFTPTHSPTMRLVLPASL